MATVLAQNTEFICGKLLKGENEELFVYSFLRSSY
jgi:hypothetical protein